MCAVSDQESEPTAAEDAPVKLEEKLRLVSRATQTTDIEAEEGGKRESDHEQAKEESPQVQITASLSEVRQLVSLVCIEPHVHVCLNIIGMPYHASM